mmetsp:Transcript_13856/g.40828  ORF Transcript_13856/g.40828 Transcript_13856/m.40828 type:complete len:246 (-) Transcript_13856:831-1568(-)
MTSRLLKRARFSSASFSSSCSWRTSDATSLVRSKLVCLSKPPTTFSRRSRLLSNAACSDCISCAYCSRISAALTPTASICSATRRGSAMVAQNALTSASGDTISNWSTTSCSATMALMPSCSSASSAGSCRAYSSSSATSSMVSVGWLSLCSTPANRLPVSCAECIGAALMRLTMMAANDRCRSTRVLRTAVHDTVKSPSGIRKGMASSISAASCRCFFASGTISAIGRSSASYLAANAASSRMR